MPEKKAKTPSRSVRYMLSADSRLRKLSLRKVSERTAAKPQPQANRVKSPAGAKTPASSWRMSTPAMVIGVVCIAGAAALIAARQSSPQTEIASDGTRPQSNAAPENAPRAASLEPVKPVVSPAGVAAAKSNAANIPAEKASASATTPAAKTPAATPKAATAVEDAAAITVTGCLELDDETFRLTDTAGGDTPKLRSWRSGFLKKRSSPIELVDPPAALKLQSYIGHRVAVTGALVKREMRAQSLRRVARACR